MLDFLTIVHHSGRIISDITNPFKHLEYFDEINTELVHFKINDAVIIGLDQLTQNETYADDSHFILLHGECYSRIDDPYTHKQGKLSARDIATVYEQFKNDFVHHIKGSFAILILSKVEQKITVFTDQLNLRSIYYHQFSDGFALSSSLTALINYLQQSGKVLKPDKRAIADRILFDFIVDNHTYIDEVSEIPPGSILRFGNNHLSITPYFDPLSYFNFSEIDLDKKDGYHLLKSILAKNIKYSTDGPGNTAVALTGGFDSRSIAALLGPDLSSYTTFSYGRQDSWDIRIPNQISETLGLKYIPIYLESEYESAFSAYAELAIALGDGVTEYSQANITYAFSRFLGTHTSVLTGLFGSELIKIPTSRGLFLDKNMIAVLNSKNITETVGEIMSKYDHILPFETDVKDELISTLRNHPFINNDLSPNEKYFQYLLRVGFRRYFSKEVKIQKILKRNIHPFYDLDFIEALLRTPYPWVHNFTLEKNLWKNLSIHQLYARLISSYPVLNDFFSTHGFKPRHLLNKMETPILAMEYFSKKKKFKEASQLNFQLDLAFKHIIKNYDDIFEDDKTGIRNLASLQKSYRRDFIKIASLQSWYKKAEVNATTVSSIHSNSFS